MTQPIIQFDGKGRAAVLSYNIPEPTIYNGQFVMKLYELDAHDLPDPADPDFAVTTCLIRPRTPAPPPSVTLAQVTEAMRAGFPSYLFPNLGVPPGVLRYVDAAGPTAYYRLLGTIDNGYGTQVPRLAIYTGIVCPQVHNTPCGVYIGGGDAGIKKYIDGLPYGQGWDGVLAPEPNDRVLTTELMNLSPTEVYNQIRAGNQLRISVDGANRWSCSWVLVTEKVQIAIIEKYRLSTFLGSYGAGRTIQTFSLLPGEKTKLTLKTYKKTVMSTRASSSIFDSFNQDSATEFESAVANERGSRSEEKDAKEWNVKAEAEVNYGFVSAKASAGYSGGTSSARENFARDMTNATQKHAAKASSKRDISITQTSETTVTTGEESSVTREIQNLNVSSTLNFVFRQMNQQFYSILHLTDVQIGYYDSSFGVKHFSVGEMEPLLDLAVGAWPAPAPPAPPVPAGVDADEWNRRWESEWPLNWAGARTAIRQRVLSELANVRNHADEQVSFVEHRTLEGTDYTGAPFTYTYWRTRNDMTSIFKDPSDPSIRFAVPGIILAATSNVMRTDGVICEAVLGLGPGLDGYSQALQKEAIRLQRLENDVQHAQNKRQLLAAAIIEAKDLTQAAIFGQVFPPPPRPAAPVVEKPAPAAPEPS
jgi:hypothetical protein